MTDDARPPVVLADFIDSHGRRVTAEETRSGLVAILTRTPDEGLNGGHPALDRERALELGTALVDWAKRESR